MAINWAIANAYRQGDIFHLVRAIPTFSVLPQLGFMAATYRSLRFGTAASRNS